MTDIEQFELAALAAGIDIEWTSPFVCIGDFAQVPNWNPLVDDGDSRRLEVTLGMEVYVDNHPEGCNCVEVQSWTYPHAGRFIEHLDDDPYAATRRAVFNCAVAIGEMMKEAS